MLPYILAKQLEKGIGVYIETTCQSGVLFTEWKVSEGFQ